ncbi:MAG: Gfo/Idh/MocA family protein [Planctomycetota bacterium]
MGISLGLVGLGAFGSAFAELFKSHPLVDRIALCDREPERVERFARKPSFQDKFCPSDAYESLDAICETDLDALVIITQPWLHAPQAVQAMEAGKHVYSAVPVIMVPDGEEILEWCDRLIQTCRGTGLRYMLGETTYYRPEAMYCRRRAAEGAFGRFVYAEGEYFHDRDLPGCNLREVRRSRLASAAGREWLEAERSYRERGIEPEAPMHYPTHSTSGPISVMGAHAVKAVAWATRRPADDDVAPGGVANETALFAMSSGAAMRICECREIGHTGQETFRVFGTEASYRDGCWVDKTSRTPVEAEAMRQPLPEAVAEAFRAAAGDGYLGGHGGSHAYLVHEFCEAVAADRQPAVNAWEAVRYMAPGVVAHQSALRDGEPLPVPDWGDAPA